MSRYARETSVQWVFQRTMHDDPPTLGTYREFEIEAERRRTFSRGFQNFVAALLQKRPSNRPTATGCLSHAFLKYVVTPLTHSNNDTFTPN